jgi:hypothetical protein
MHQRYRGRLFPFIDTEAKIESRHSVLEAPAGEKQGNRVVSSERPSVIRCLSGLTFRNGLFPIRQLPGPTQ